MAQTRPYVVTTKLYEFRSYDVCVWAKGRILQGDQKVKNVLCTRYSDRFLVNRDVLEDVVVCFIRLLYGFLYQRTHTSGLLPPLF